MRFEQALLQAIEMGDRNQQIEALIGLGNTYAANGDPVRALGYHQRGLGLSEELGLRFRQSAAHDGLARVHQALGDEARARDHWRRAGLPVDVYEDRPAEVSTPR